MGKLIPFCGFDETSEEVWKLTLHTIHVCGKENPDFLLIPTSAFDDFNKGTLNTYNKAGCNVDKLLLSEPYITEEIVAEKIRWADIISVPGGNVKYLMEMWKKSNAVKYLTEAYESGTVLTGSSAGSMCWFAESYDNCGVYDSKMFVDSMGLKDYVICPHYESPDWVSFDEDVKTRKRNGIAIEDGAALCLIDGKNYILKAKGTETCWFFDSKNNFCKTDLSENEDLLLKI